jgi:hypothetical protein
MNVQFNTKFKILAGQFWVSLTIGDPANNQFCQNFTTIDGIYPVNTFLNSIESLYNIQKSP